MWLKCECLQTGGRSSCAARPTACCSLTPEERERGVVAFSSGNHAQGVAIAARRLGIRATIVMPSDAPAVKVEATRSHGAEIIFYDRRTESREEIAARLAAEQGAIVVPSFDDPAIVAGQGTVGLEILEQLGRPPATDRRPLRRRRAGVRDRARLPGQPRSSSSSPKAGTTCAARSPAAQIVPVEPDAPATLCDALQTPRVSPITFGILRERGAEALAVTDAEVKQAVRFAWSEHQLVVEPGGAAALAALLAGKVEPPKRNRRRAVRRQYRSGAARPDRRRSLGCGGPVLAGLEVHGLERSTAWVSSSSSAARVCSSAASALGSVSATGGGVEQGVEHHRDARQDRFLDPLERLVEARLLFGRVHRAIMARATS